MGKINATTKLIVENFPDQREWISPMFNVLNDFIQNVVSAINGGLSFTDNLQGRDQEIDFSYVTVANSIPKIKWEMTAPPKALQVVSAYEAAPVSAGEVARNFSPAIILLSWGLNAQNFIVINDAVKITSSGGVTSLTSTNRYKIRVRITP